MTAGLDELQRSLKQRQVLFVIRRISAIDLYPFPGAGEPARLKRDNIVSRELQFRCNGGRQPQPHSFTADAGEHLVADEISVQAVKFSGAGPREFEKQGVDLGLAIGCGGVGGQGQIRVCWSEGSGLIIHATPRAFSQG
jgi:hypothetical protein